VLALVRFVGVVFFFFFCGLYKTTLFHHLRFRRREDALVRSHASSMERALRDADDRLNDRLNAELGKQRAALTAAAARQAHEAAAAFEAKLEAALEQSRSAAGAAEAASALASSERERQLQARITDLQKVRLWPPRCLHRPSQSSFWSDHRGRLWPKIMVNAAVVVWMATMGVRRAVNEVVVIDVVKAAGRR
jgi:hypothetical protein